MQAKRILTVAALFAAALFILDVPAAMATDRTWEGDVSSDWNDPNNWNPAGVPDRDDEAIIPEVTDPNCAKPVVPATPTNAVGAITIQNGGHLTVETSSAGTQSVLTVDENGETGKLIIVSGGKLTIGIDGTLWLDDAVIHEIGGTIELTDEDSILRFDETATVDGHNAVDGTIDGQDNSAKTEITDGKTLTNQITIEGNLQIVGTAGENTTRFINDTDGLVHADAAGTLDLNVDALDDGVSLSAGNWRVSTSGNAILRFTTGCYSLSGRFDVDDGKLDIVASVDDAGVCTTGDLDFTGGTIDVASDKSFKAGGSCP